MPFLILFQEELQMKRSFRIPYGHNTLPLEIEDRLLKAVLVPEAESISSPTLEEQTDIVLRALDHPIGSPRPQDLAAGKQRVLIITSDHTRPMPSYIKAQIHELDSLLAASSAEYTSQLQLVTGIPGVSNDSALEILSEISPSPQHDFDSAEKLCSWAGLVPRNVVDIR
jgi:transposase